MEATFHWYDYFILIFTLLISTFIGIYFGYTQKKTNIIDKYMLGGRKMKILPIALSVAVSHFTSATPLGIPAEVYRFGASYIWTCVGVIFVILMAIFVYLPVFYHLELISVFDYLEKRFDQKTRMFVFCLSLASDLFVFGYITYGPSLSLSAVTGIDIHLVSILMCGVCAFYTVVGGFKTVVWTDLFQFAVIAVPFVGIFVIGINLNGGFSSVWNASSEGGRLNIFDFDLDPTKRSSFWIMTFGSGLAWTGDLVTHQTSVQKYLALPTFRACVWSLCYVAIITIIVQASAVLMGLMLFATYANCGPFQTGQIAKPDEILPYFVGNLSKTYPGILGLLIAAIFGASMSTMSSMFNSLSGIIYKDLISHYFKNLTDRTIRNVLNLIVGVLCLICVCLVFVIKHLGDIVPVYFVLMGVTQGPILGVFTLGVLFPRAGVKSVFFGAFGAMITMAVIIGGNKYYGMRGFEPPSLNCSQSQTLDFEQFDSREDDLNQPLFIFKISVYYNVVLGWILTVILGLIISYVVKKNDREVDKSLISPIIHFILPKSSRNCEYVGVQLQEAV